MSRASLRPRYDVVTWGETMIRLNAPGFSRLEEAISLDLRIGGSESNTAVALTRLGLRTAWYSKLPDNPLGRRIASEIRRWGVDTSSIAWDRRPEARAGLYFLDFGVPPRGIDVYYDRARSAMTTVLLEEIAQDPIEETRLVHLTGITPALSENCREAVSHIIFLAERAGTPVSFDVNYRAKLWTPTEAKRSLEPIIKRTQLLFCPQSDAATVFGIAGEGLTVARELKARYGVPAVVVTCGGEGAVAIDAQGEYQAQPFPLTEIVDRVGAGDAFGAGVMMGYLQNDLALGMEYGMAMSALKHTMPGDLLLSTRAEIETARTGQFTGIRR